METWEVQLDDWTKISSETANLYLDLATVRLDETIETSKSITEKNDKVLGILMAFITGLLGYVSTKGWNLFGYDYFITSIIISILFTAIPLLKLTINLKFFTLGTKGEEPKFILKQPFIEYEEKEQYLNLVLHMCETYQKKIDINLDCNTVRRKRLNFAIYSLLTILISYFLLSVLVYLIFDPVIHL